MPVIKKLTIKKNDLQPYYYIQVKDSAGAVVDITDATIYFSMKTIDGVLKINRTQVTPAWITDPTNGKFEYRWSSGDTDTVGTYYIEAEINPQAGGKFTLPTDNSAVVEIIDDLDTI